MRVALDFGEPARSSSGSMEHDAFGDDRDAVAPAVAQALDDRADQRVDDGLEPERACLELLRDERQRGARGLADAERQVPGLPAHRDDEVPARRGLGVDHQVLDDLDAVVARGLEAERVDVRRQVQVVVDGLGHVHDADAAAGVLLELHRREGRVVAADGDELRHVQAQQREHGVLEMLRVLGGVGARDADVRAAAEVDAADAFDRERDDVLDVALHDPLEAVADADDLDAFEPRADRRRADHAVDARGRPAADENRHVGVVFHAGMISSRAGKERVMDIAERTSGKVTVLDLSGKITLGEGDVLLKDKLHSLLNQGHKQILLNLAQVSYVDSAGLGGIVAAHDGDARRREPETRRTSPSGCRICCRLPSC